MWLCENKKSLWVITSWQVCLITVYMCWWASETIAAPAGGPRADYHQINNSPNLTNPSAALNAVTKPTPRLVPCFTVQMLCMPFASGSPMPKAQRLEIVWHFPKSVPPTLRETLVWWNIAFRSGPSNAGETAGDVRMCHTQYLSYRYSMNHNGSVSVV